MFTCRSEWWYCILWSYIYNTWWCLAMCGRLPVASSVGFMWGGMTTWEQERHCNWIIATYHFALPSLCYKTQLHIFPHVTVLSPQWASKSFTNMNLIYHLYHVYMALWYYNTKTLPFSVSLQVMDFVQSGTLSERIEPSMLMNHFGATLSRYHFISLRSALSH